MKPTYLYVKEHTETHLKYFGKTTKKDPEKYLGSGIYWKIHIKKYGTDKIKTIWTKLFTDENELKAFALKFSQENDIVNSNEWANLKEENGLDGGFDKGWWSEEQIKHNSEMAIQRWKSGKYDHIKEQFAKINIGKKYSEDRKNKIAKGNSAKWSVTSPEGIIMEIENLRKFCRENGLDQGNLSRGSHKGWKATKINN